MTTLNQTIEVHEESSTNTVWLYMHGARAQDRRRRDEARRFRARWGVSMPW